MLLTTMACPVCSNLQNIQLERALVAEHAVGRPTPRVIHFITLSDLKASAEARECDECTLLWNCLNLFSIQWTKANLHTSAELRWAPGKQLQFFWRPKPLYLELFTRARKNLFVWTRR